MSLHVVLRFYGKCHIEIQTFIITVIYDKIGLLTFFNFLSNTGRK